MGMPTQEEIRERVAKNVQRYASVRERYLEAQEVVDTIGAEQSKIIDALVHDDIRTIRLPDGRTVSFRRPRMNASKWHVIEHDPPPAIDAPETVLAVKMRGG